LIRKLFEKEAPQWIRIITDIGEEWSACLQTLEGHGDYVISVAFSPDSTRLASGSDDKKVKIWDARSGACLQTLEGHGDYVISVAFSPDSTRLASGSYDKKVKIWDARSGACLQTLEGHRWSVNSVAFSPDSTRLASGSSDKTVKIWDARSGACLQTLEGHGSSVNSVAFSPDLTRLASGSVDNTVKIWDARSGACLHTFKVNNIVRRMKFDQTGRLLRTNIGTLVLGTSTSPVLHNPTNLDTSHVNGWGLSSDKVWITFNSNNTLWLPAEYRPSCSDVSRQMIGIGVSSGKIWIYQLQDDIN
jgi:WD40 repeat protein